MVVANILVRIIWIYMDKRILVSQWAELYAEHEAAVSCALGTGHNANLKCGNLAYISHRLVDNDKRVLLGETQEYEPLCRECYQKALAEQNKEEK